jgi:hypothetical protein
MLPCVVNSQSQPRPAICQLGHRQRDENPAASSPSKSVLTNNGTGNSFRIRIYRKRRVGYPSFFYSPSLFTFLDKNRFCKPRVFYALRTLPSSVSCKSFACHSYENNRGVAKLFPQWNSASTPQSISLQLGTRLSATSYSGSPINSHSRRLTPSPSADSINLHPADRSFRRKSYPRGGGIP